MRERERGGGGERERGREGGRGRGRESPAARFPHTRVAHRALGACIAETHSHAEKRARARTHTHAQTHAPTHTLQPPPPPFPSPFTARHIFTAPSLPVRADQAIDAHATRVLPPPPPPPPPPIHGGGGRGVGSIVPFLRTMPGQSSAPGDADNFVVKDSLVE